MELTSVRCLANSISRFIHLATCCVLKMPSQRDFKIMASCLKQLKPLLDNVLDNKIPTDDTACNACEELDMAVNEAREFLEKWSPKMSKIVCVLQSEQLLFTIQSSSRKIVYTLHELLESAPTTLNLPFPQNHMEEFRSSENVSKLIEEAIACQSRGKVPHAEHLCTIVESLALTSKYELLNELIAVEKERVKAENNNLKRDSDTLDNIIDLISNIRNYMFKCGTLSVFEGMQIPSYFQCPLSLELMVDPVIVASGQTYDRTSIQKWLDNGLILCPKTHQRLSHTNLIPNYTVKALIVNFCEENGIKLPEPHGSPDNTSDLTQPADIGQVDSNCSLQNNSYTLELPCEVEKGCDKEKNGSLESRVRKLNIQSEIEAVRVTHSSPEHLYSHSRTESTSSAISSIDYIPGGSTDVSRISSKHGSVSDASGEITSDSHTSVNKYLENSPLSSRQYQSSKTLSGVPVSGKHNLSRGFSFQSESSSNDLTTTAHVEEVVKELTSQTTELQTSAAAELRFLAKNNMENRLIIGHCGAIAPLISLLYSDVKITQEHAVTALLNLSICEKIKATIGEEGAIEPLIYVLRTGSAVARENAAAALFSLSLLEEYRIKIGRTGAVKALVELLGSGSVRGKKDAATALFNLSIYHENKARIIQAGAVKHLVDLLDPEKEMVDKAIAVLANLSTISEGCIAIAREGGIPALVEILETGSARGKENAASTLLQLCMNSPKYCRLILQEGAVPPLVALSQSGTPRAKEKVDLFLLCWYLVFLFARWRGPPGLNSFSVTSGTSVRVLPGEEESHKAKEIVINPCVIQLSTYNYASGM